MEEILYSEFIRRLGEFDIIASRTESGVIFTSFRMGVGTGQMFYPLAYHGEEHPVSPPTIAHLLDYFEINEWEWEGAD